MIKLTGISVAFGDRHILQSIDFLIRPNDKIGLVGPNGTGKTTLLKVVAGE